MVIALFFVACLALLGLFQLALALGAPWGAYVWGGTDSGVLPRNKRIGSALSLLVLGLMAVFALDLAGFVVLWPNWVSLIGMWVTFGYFLLNTVLNLLSKSRLERIFMTPVSALFAVVSFLIALGGPVSYAYTGMVLETGGEVRWCPAVLESYPPQCGEGSLVLQGWDWAGLDPQSADGVTWGEYDFTGVRDGSTVTVEGDVVPLR